jgi:hypothetical protein
MLLMPCCFWFVFSRTTSVFASATFLDQAPDAHEIIEVLSSFFGLLRITSQVSFLSPSSNYSTVHLACSPGLFVVCSPTTYFNEQNISLISVLYAERQKKRRSRVKEARKEGES